MVDNLKLFEQTARDFSSNGLGFLSDATKCTVEEERNGIFELELEYPMTGRRFSDIQLRNIIVAKPNPYANPQPFRIYQISKPIKGLITVNARHISYDLSDWVCLPFLALTSNGTPAGHTPYYPGVIQYLQSEHTVIKDRAGNNTTYHGAVYDPDHNFPFHFETDMELDFTWDSDDKADDHRFKFFKPASVRSVLGDSKECGVLGKFINETEGSEDYGQRCEIEYDGYNIRIKQHRGTETGFEVRYGKNMTDLDRSETADKDYTAIFPFWKAINSEDTTVKILDDGSRYESIDGASNQYRKFLVRDLSSDFENVPNAQDMRKYARQYIKDEDLKGNPSINVTVNFQELSKSSEYAQYKELEKVQLCDIVTVVHEGLGIRDEKKVIKTTYDVLSDQYISIDLGDPRDELAGTISNTVNVTNITDNSTNVINSQVVSLDLDSTMKNITAIYYLKTNDEQVPTPSIIVTETRDDVENTWTTAEPVAKHDGTLYTSQQRLLSSGSPVFDTPVVSKIVNAVKGFIDTTENPVTGEITNTLAGDKLTAESVDTPSLADGAVETEKIEDQAVTYDKIAVDAIHSGNYTEIPAWSSGNSYSYGDYVIYNGQAYECVETTTGAWNPSKWKALPTDLFSDSGTFFDLSSNGLLKSRNFAIDSDGTVYLRGDIYANGGNLGGWSITNEGLVYAGGANDDRIDFSPSGELTADGPKPYISATGSLVMRISENVSGKEPDETAVFAIGKDGKLYATRGEVAGWSIENETLVHESDGQNNNVYLFGTTSSVNVFNADSPLGETISASSAVGNLVMRVGDASDATFALDENGAIYAMEGHIGSLILTSRGLEYTTGEEGTAPSTALNLKDYGIIIKDANDAQYDLSQNSLFAVVKGESVASELNKYGYPAATYGGTMLITAQIYDSDGPVAGLTLGKPGGELSGHWTFWDRYAPQSSYDYWEPNIEYSHGDIVIAPQNMGEGIVYNKLYKCIVNTTEYLNKMYNWEWEETLGESISGVYLNDDMEHTLQERLNSLRDIYNSYAPPIATTSTLGVVKIGSGLTINAAGLLSLNYDYTLPTATSSVLGGIKVGTNLTIDSATGVLSAVDTTYAAATSSVLGLVKIQNGANTGLSIDAAGSLRIWQPENATGKFLKAGPDGTVEYAVPPDTNTTYALSVGTGTDSNKIVLNPSSGNADKIIVPYASIAGNALEANGAYKLVSDVDGTALSVGNGTTPVYFSGGIPTALGYTIAKSVPSDAKFTDTTYSAGTGLSLSGTTFNHSNSVTSVTTAGAYKFKFDSQGHITGTSSLTYSDVGAASAAHTHTYSQVGAASAAHTHPTFSTETNGFVPGPAPDETGFLKANGTWDTPQNTTYSAGTGLSLSGTTFNHSNSVTSVTTAGAYKFKFDSQGHITGTSALTYSDVGAASSGHTHTYSQVGAASAAHTHSTTVVSTATGTATALAFGTKYTITAGGTSAIVQMPSKPTYTYSDVGAASAAHTHSTYGDNLGLEGGKIILMNGETNLSSVTLTYNSVGAASAAHTHSTYGTTISISGHTISLKNGTTTLSSVTVPDNNTTYSAGTGLSLSGTTFNHSNSVTAVTTAGLYKVKYDAQGHITGTTAVAKADITGLGIPGSDTNTTYALSVGTGTDSNKIVLTPSSGNANKITVPYASIAGNALEANGAYKLVSDVDGTALSVGNGTTPVYFSGGVPTALGYTIAKSVPSDAKFTDTTYSAGTGLSLSGTTFNHSNSVTSVTTAGLYKVKYDAQGHITGTTAVAKADITALGIPGSDTNTTYSFQSGTTNGKFQVKASNASAWTDVAVYGLGTAAYTASTAYAPATHSHVWTDISNRPSSLPNTYSLTVKAGSDQVFTYDGSAAKTMTVAASTTSGAFTISDGTTTKTVQLAGKFTDTTYTAGTAVTAVSTTSAVGTSTNYARQDHVHNISLATGDNNGQVKIAGTNVSVKGLGSAAYTSSDGYASVEHTHVAGDIDSGQFALARIPTGTTSTTVARGDHTHTASSIGAAPSVRATDGTGKTKIGWLTFAKRTDINSTNALSSEIMWIDITRTYNDPAPECYSLLFHITYNTTGISTDQVNFILINGTIRSTPIIKKIRCSKDITNHIAFLEIYVDPAYTTYENLTYINLRPMSGTAAEKWTPVTPYTIQTANVTTVAELDLTSGTKLNNLNVIGTINGSGLTTYLATVNPTGAWKALGGRSSGFNLAIGRWQSSPPAWTSGDYSSSLVFGGADTKGMLGLSYYSPSVTFGGGSVNGSTDAAPIWYFKLLATKGQSYTFPSASKTLAASDGSNASGTWRINVLPFNSGESGVTIAESTWVTTNGQNKVYDNQSNKKWIWGSKYTSSGWPSSDTGDMRFWLYGDSAGQWLNMNLDGYYFSIKGFIGDSSSATVGLSTAPMYAGYFTNLSANKITATELYGDSIKAALGDYNGVVTYNADTNALDVNTTAAYDAWGKTSGGGIFYPSAASQPAMSTGTVLMATASCSNLLKDASDSDDAGIVVLPHILTSTSVSSIPAGTTTYQLPNAANPMRYYPELYSKLSALFSNIYYRTNAAESLTGQSPTAVSAATGGALSLTFASSLNPSTAATRLRMGAGTGDKFSGIAIGTGVYNNGQASLLIGMCGYNSGNYACAIGQAVYNDSALGAALFGARLYNNAGRSLVVGADNKNMQANSVVLGEGHDTTNGSSCVTVVGKYSLVTSTTAFAVGGGTSVSARSNLFEVSTAGVVTSSRTTTSSLGTNSVPWHHVHTTGLTVYEAGEVGLPFEGDGFLKYDNDNGLYLDTSVYLPKSGGTVTGALTFGASVADNRKLVPSANATGYVGTSSVRWGAGYFNALYCGSSNTNVGSKLSDHESRITALEEGTCLIEGTKILMADNSEKNIEDVKEGDLIMSYDPNTNKLCEAVVIGNYRTGISNDFTNYYFEDGSYLTIFGGHLVYSANQGIARHIKHFEPGWTSITPECKETAFVGSENIDNVGHKRHYSIHSSNKLYFANGILNGQSMTLDYARYRDKDFPEEYLQALKADYDAGYNINKFKTDKEVGATLVPILKELKAQKKVMDDNKKRLADSDYLVAKFTEGLISAAEWLKAKAERAGWRSAVNKAEPLYAAAEERYNAFKAKYKAPNTKRERFNAAVARDNACLDVLKAYYKSRKNQNETNE